MNTDANIINWDYTGVVKVVIVVGVIVVISVVVFVMFCTVIVYGCPP